MHVHEHIILLGAKRQTNKVSKCHSTHYESKPQIELLASNHVSGENIFRKNLTTMEINNEKIF